MRSTASSRRTLRAAASSWRPLRATLGRPRLGHVAQGYGRRPASARAAPSERGVGIARRRRNATRSARTPLQEDDDGQTAVTPDLSAALLGVEDPIDDDRQPGRLRAHLPDLGGRSLRGDLHRPGRRLLRGASARRLRADHHRRHDHPSRGALLGVQLPRALEGRPGRRPRPRGRGRAPPRLQARVPAAAPRACAPCPC